MILTVTTSQAGGNVRKQVHSHDDQEQEPGEPVHQGSL